MQTFDQVLYDLVNAGRISEEVALDAADSRNNLSLRLRLESGAGAEEDSGLRLKEIDKCSFFPD
jgi:twitching motility protein PilU